MKDETPIFFLGAEKPDSKLPGHACCSQGCGSRAELQSCDWIACVQWLPIHPEEPEASIILNTDAHAFPTTGSQTPTATAHALLSWAANGSDCARRKDCFGASGQFLPESAPWLCTSKPQLHLQQPQDSSAVVCRLTQPARQFSIP